MFPFFFPSLVTYILSSQIFDLQRRDVTWPFFLSFKGLSAGPWIQLLYNGLESSSRKKTCPKICHLRVLIPLKHEWNYTTPLLRTISPIVKVLVFTVALQLPVNFLSSSSFFPTSLLYSALLLSSPPPHSALLFYFSCVIPFALFLWLPRSPFS